MPATLVASGVAVTRGAAVVLDRVSLTVAPGDRVGVLGPNGVGKSTLLRALAGLEILEAGRVDLAPPTATVGLLPQEPDRREGETLVELLGRRTGVTRASADLDAATAGLAGGAAGADDTYAAALERWLDLGGADLEVRAGQVCAELGLPAAALEQATTALSGGQAARGSLASVLLSRFDVTLLDEPTNDLDFDGLERLERFCASVSGALVVVSHDREFLDRVITSVVEVDPHAHGVSEYAGGWAAYLRAREVARRHAREDYEEYADTRAGLAAQAQRQREQSVRGAVRAQRRGKDNDKSIRGSRVEAATKSAGRVRGIDSRLARLEEVEEPRKEWQLQMTIAAAPRSGDVVATLSGAVVRRGGFRLGPVDLTVAWADRIIVTGRNGSGKSSLLAALLGRLSLQQGRQALGPGVLVGGVDQAREVFRGPASMLATAERATGWAPQEVRTLFAKYGLTRDHMTRAAGSLSPGERTRAGLALLQSGTGGAGVNCLVLDEPTNHLDLPALEQLEAALDGYAATLLLVTHDRRLLEAVRVTRRLVVEAGQVAEVAP